MSLSGGTRCPACDLINPATAATCDCGYSFRDDGSGSSPTPHRPTTVEVNRAPLRRIAIVICLVFALLFTLLVWFAGGFFGFDYGLRAMGGMSVFLGFGVVPVVVAIGSIAVVQRSELIGSVMLVAVYLLLVVWDLVDDHGPD